MFTNAISEWVSRPRNLAGGLGNRIKKIEEWLDHRYPAILRKAEEQGAIIFFLDESTAKSECHRSRTWGIKGITPVVKTTGSRHRLNIVSVVSSEGILRYRTFTGKMDRFMFVDYLKSLVRSVDKSVIIITDGHPAHRAKYTKDYVEQEPRLLGLHLLPSYSPELNPDEQVWNQLKAKLGKAALKTKDEFIGFVRSQMGYGSIKGKLFSYIYLILCELKKQAIYKFKSRHELEKATCSFYARNRVFLVTVLGGYFSDEKPGNIV